MEGDTHVMKEVNLSGNGTFIAEAVTHLKKAHGSDIESIMTDARYA
jgi:ferrous iron transport protein B